MIEQDSINNLAHLDVTLMVLEKTMADKEAKIVLRACQMIIDNIVHNEHAEADFVDAIERLGNSMVNGLDRLNAMSEKNRKIMIEYGWNDLRRRIE